MGGQKGNKLIELCTTDEHHASPETVRRVIEIAGKIIDGEPRYKLLNYIKERYGLKNQSAQLYYDAALRYLIPSPEEQEDFREKMRAKLVARYEKLYKDAVGRENIKVAKDILDSMAKMYGVVDGNSVKIKEELDGSKEIEISFG